MFHLIRCRWWCLRAQSSALASISLPMKKQKSGFFLSLLTPCACLHTNLYFPQSGQELLGNNTRRKKTQTNKSSISDTLYAIYSHPVTAGNTNYSSQTARVQPLKREEAPGSQHSQQGNCASCPLQWMLRGCLTPGWGNPAPITILMGKMSVVTHVGTNFPQGNNHAHQSSMFTVPNFHLSSTDCCKDL